MAKKQEDSQQKESVRKGEKSSTLSTQRYLQFSEAHDDTLVLQNGGMRAILEVTSVNFNLKSSSEQDAIISSYQHFLNSLNFPVQILIKSRKLDIDLYLQNLAQKKKKIASSLLRKQMDEYAEFVGKLVENADIMEKKFYVVVPQDPYRSKKQNTFEKFLSYIKPDDTVMDILRRRKEFTNLKKELDTNVNVVSTSLTNCNLGVRRLRTEEIIEIFYQSYNPQLARAQKFSSIEDLAIQEDPAEFIEREVE